MTTEAQATESSIAIEKAFKKGDKRDTAIEIMKKFMNTHPNGHVLTDVTAEIGTTLGIPEGSARSYYTFIVKNKLIDGFVSAPKADRKARTPSEPKEKTAAPEMTPEAKADRLTLMKNIAKKTKKPSDITKRIEELAARGAHHATAPEPEPTKVTVAEVEQVLEEA